MENGSGILHHIFGTFSEYMNCIPGCNFSPNFELLDLLTDFVAGNLFDVSRIRTGNTWLLFNDLF